MEKPYTLLNHSDLSELQHSVACVIEFTQRSYHALLQSCYTKGTFFFMLSCLKNALLFYLTRGYHSSVKKPSGLDEVAQSQVHDMHYWFSYNERQGNKSQ